MRAIRPSLLLCAITVSAIPSFSFAADGSSGCGVGWYIFKENSLVSSSLRTITNNYLPNTFSMTSGTSNCAKHSIIFNEKRGLHFVESNAEALEYAIASGEGQFLQGFAESMGCVPEVSDVFATSLRAGFENIFAYDSKPGNLDKTELYYKMKSELRKNEVLRNQCALVGQTT
jgi:hypothetical protein